MLNNKVVICGVNTAKLPILSREKKIELFERIKKGDTSARDEFIEGNLRLVLSIIQKFNNRGENLDDLFQVGCVGLIKAIDNFDTSHGVQFSTYAVPMVIGEIRRHLRDNNPIRVSRSVRDLAHKALSTKEAFIKEYQREPTIMELAKILDVEKEEITIALEAILEPVSLFEPIYNDGGDTIYVMDQVKDDKNNEFVWASNISLNEGLKKLNDREKNIVNLRFFQGKTQMEVADEIGISQAQVSRLEKNALFNMRKHIT